MNKPVQGFYVARADNHTNCIVRVQVLQENRAAIVSRVCGEKVVLTIRIDDHDWPRPYCEAHALRRLQDLARDLMKPEEEKVEDKRSA